MFAWKTPTTAMFLIPHSAGCWCCYVILRGPSRPGHAEVHELQRGVTTGSDTARSGVLRDAKIGAVGGVHQMLGCWIQIGYGTMAFGRMFFKPMVEWRWNNMEDLYHSICMYMNICSMIILGTFVLWGISYGFGMENTNKWRCFSAVSLDTLLHPWLACSHGPKKGGLTKKML